MSQLDLLSRRIVRTPAGDFDKGPRRSVVDHEETLDRRFERFVEENPHVYREFVRFAREARRAGLRVGAKAVWERLRWELAIATTDAEWKLNNSFTSRMARLAMEREPDLAGFFETREIKS